MGFRDSRSDSDENKGLEKLYGSPMFNSFDDLRDCLVGYLHGGHDPEPGCKVSLWVADGRVKVCISDEANDQVAFGTLDHSKQLGEALDWLLRDGDLDWKKNKNSRRK